MNAVPYLCVCIAPRAQLINRGNAFPEFCKDTVINEYTKKPQIILASSG